MESKRDIKEQTYSNVRQFKTMYLNIFYTFYILSTRGQTCKKCIKPSVTVETEGLTNTDS